MIAQQQADEAKRSATAGLAVGGLVCVLVCITLGVLADDRGKHHFFFGEGAGADVTAQVFGIVLAGKKSYMNGGSASVSCQVDALAGVTLEAGGGEDETSPGGGGVGISYGMGGGCTAMHTYTYDAWD